MEWFEDEDPVFLSSRTVMMRGLRVNILIHRRRHKKINPVHTRRVRIMLRSPDALISYFLVCSIQTNSRTPV